ncbi:hypothetical protein L1987_36823 [Smallanthus sonchifolius]|uniref:Uncharacterized protein n=1 Tax=Smallanthus sonchifolius TaxID=185202 RepID=A0ACB9HEM8_9ASTR|nr:hypothetical protein L1987_36823 [Smallanthus sonchifolius]
MASKLGNDIKQHQLGDAQFILVVYLSIESACAARPTADVFINFISFRRDQGLVGDHQYVNDRLAIKLCSTWLQNTGRLEPDFIDQNKG